MSCRSRKPALTFAAVVAAAAWLSRAFAGEVLINEDFEKLDLAKLPSNYVINTPAELSIVTDPQKGKSLRISHAGGGEAALGVSLDIAKVRGRTVRAAVSAKCPKSYTPIPEKTGYPQLVILYRDDAGSKGTVAPVQPDSVNWQDIAATYAIPATATQVFVICRILAVQADVYFDDLTVDVLPIPGAADIAIPPPAAEGPAKNALTPATLEQNPAQKAAAAQVPKKTLEEDGFLFSGDIFIAAQAAHKQGMTPNTIALVGPGLPNPELEAKAPSRWTFLPTAREVAGVLIAPERLSSSLPAFIVKNKPEVVVLVGEVRSSRKLSLDERSEWEDLAKICARFGAVPVLAIPTAATPGDLRKEMLEAADATHCAVIELRAPLDKRLGKLLSLIEKHVFERTPPPATEKPGEE